MSHLPKSFSGRLTARIAGASCRRAHYTEWIDCPVWLFNPVVRLCDGRSWCVAAALWQPICV